MSDKKLIKTVIINDNLQIDVWQALGDDWLVECIGIDNRNRYWASANITYHYLHADGSIVSSTHDTGTGGGWFDTLEEVDLAIHTLKQHQEKPKQKKVEFDIVYTGDDLWAGTEQFGKYYIAVDEWRHYLHDDGEIHFGAVAENSTGWFETEEDAQRAIDLYREKYGND